MLLMDFVTQPQIIPENRIMKVITSYFDQKIHQYHNHL